MNTISEAVRCFQGEWSASIIPCEASLRDQWHQTCWATLFKGPFLNPLFYLAKTMARVKRNEFIVNLQGISFANKQVYLLLEFCSNKSLQMYLNEHYEEYNQKAKDNMDYRFLMKCCSQVASGMIFLADSKIKHVSLHFNFVINSPFGSLRSPFFEKKNDKKKFEKKF